MIKKVKLNVNFICITKKKPAKIYNKNIWSLKMRKINFFAWILVLFALLLILFLIYEFTSRKFNMAKNFFYDKQKNKNISMFDGQENFSSEIIVTPSTKIIYKYYYEDDGFSETTSELAPEFLIGMNKNELKKTFAHSHWKINNFSREKVVLQKNISATNKQNYVLGVKDGYVAVFYQEKNLSGLKLKEITNTPINSLSLDEQKRLNGGIKVSGEDKLILIMQDYES